MTTSLASILSRYGFGVVVVLVVAALAACGGSGSSSGTSTAGEPMTVPAQPAEVKVGVASESLVVRGRF